MKLSILMICACVIMSAHAQWGGRFPNDDGPLVPLVPFEDAVKSAKTGDGAGLYSLAIHLAAGREIGRDSELAYKFLCSSADAGFPCAIFIRHVVDEEAMSGDGTRSVSLSRYVEKGSEFWSTNLNVYGRSYLSERGVPEMLIGLYKEDLERGVAAAKVEIARIEDAVKDNQRRLAEYRKRQEERRRKAKLLANEMGVDVSRILPPEPRPNAPERGGVRGTPAQRARRQASRRSWQSYEEGKKLLVEPIPFAKAAEMASKGDAGGLYAVAVHYAIGKEIEKNGDLAFKYLAKAAEADNPNAILVKAMCAENRLETKANGRHYIGGLGNEDRHPDAWVYTGGATLSDFQAWRSKTRCGSFTNSSDIAAIEDQYRKAARLGSSAATNELARFEARVRSVLKTFERDRPEFDAQRELFARNAQVARDVLGEDPEADALNDADDEIDIRSELAQIRQRIGLLRDTLYHEISDRKAERGTSVEEPEASGQWRRRFLPRRSSLGRPAPAEASGGTNSTKVVEERRQELERLRAASEMTRKAVEDAREKKEADRPILRRYRRSAKGI